MRLLRLGQVDAVPAPRQLGREWQPREPGRLHHELHRLGRVVGRAAHELVDALLGLRNREWPAEPLPIFVDGGLVRCPERDVDSYSSHADLLVVDRRGRSSITVRVAQNGASFAVTPVGRASHLLNRALSYGGR